MQFTKAVRKKAKLRLALTGPSGSGKTYGALMIAKGLGGKIAVIDTEHGSASLYSNLCEFDTLELTAPYSPERYIQAIKAAEAAGYDTLIIDSTTHEWSGSGGCLEINEQTAQAKFRGNTWSAWNETTPRHRKFIDAMLQSSMHIIATGRSKTETSQEDAGNGKKKVVKLGMKTEQRDGFEYEFTVVLDIVHDGHFALASKDRTNLFGGTPFKVDDSTGRDLAAWLESGADIQPIAPWYEEFLLTLEGCETPDELGAAWGAAKKAANERGDKAAYDAMKSAMEGAAAAIKEAMNASPAA